MRLEFGNIAKVLQTAIRKSGQQACFCLMVFTPDGDDAICQLYHTLSDDCLLAALKEQVRLLEQGSTEHEAHAWADDQIISFAEHAYPCGTMNGWSIRKEGNPRLNSTPARVPCAAREGYVHIMLEA